MAHLKYTDGSNGNGITAPGQLLAYVRRFPLALGDERFMASYIPLIKSDPKVMSEFLAVDEFAWCQLLRGEKPVSHPTDDLRLFAEACGIPYDKMREIMSSK